MGKISNGLITSNAKVINLSLGSDEKEVLDNIKSGLGFFGKIFSTSKLQQTAESVARIYQEEFQRFVSNHPKRAFVVAAGNSNLDISSYKNSTAKVKGNNVIVVGATDRADKIAVFSNYSNKYTDIAALGSAVKSALAEGGEISMSGSSMAAPIVTNEILRRMENNPTLKPVEAMQVVLDSAKQNFDLQTKVIQGRLIPYELIAGGSLAVEEAPEQKFTTDKPFSNKIIHELVAKVRTDIPTKMTVEFTDATVSLLTTKNNAKLIEISRLPSNAQFTTDPSIICLATKLNL